LSQIKSSLSAIKTFDPTIIVDEKPEETLNARWQAKVAGAIGRLKEEKPEVEKRLSTLQQLSGETPVAWSHVLRRCLCLIFKFVIL